MIIAHARGSIGSLERRLGPGAKWIFAGSDELQLRCWEASLGARGQRLDLSTAIDAAAARLRSPFLQWLADQARRLGHEPHWWCLDISERNTLLSPLYERLCALDAVRETLDRERVDLIVAESHGLIAALETLCRGRGLDCVLEHRAHRWADRCAERARPILNQFVFALRSIQRILNAWRTRAGPCVFPEAEKPRLLIRTYIHPGDLSSNGDFKDRYFPGLRERAESAGHEAWLLGVPHNMRWLSASHFRALRSGKQRFIVPEDWLEASDYLEAWRCASAALRAPSGRQSIAGMDATPLLDEERWRQAGSRRSLDACLMLRLFHRLREAGFRPKVVIDWWENQLLNKALALGARSADPNVEVRGYFASSMLRNLLNHYPMAVECGAGVVPNVVVCGSALARDVLRRESDGALENVVRGGSTRFSHLPGLSARLLRQKISRTTILLALPQSLPTSALIVRAAIELASREPSKEWLVKPHGDYGVDELAALLPKELPRSMRVVEGSLARWMEGSPIFVTGESWAAVEAAACGLPIVLFRRPQSLDFDPFGWLEDVDIPRCSDASGLERAIGLAAQATPAERRRLAERLLRDCLSNGGDDPWGVLLSYRTNSGLTPK